MLKYNGNLFPNEKQIIQMNALSDCLEFIEEIYIKNIDLLSSTNKYITIEDEEINRQLKIILESNKTEAEKNFLVENIVREAGYLNEKEQRQLFNSLVLDFCLWMENSLQMIKEFKPQLAFALARKPLIDEIYYLQLLYLDPQNAVKTVFLDNVKDKEILKQKDKELCEKVCKELNFCEINPYELRYSEPYGIIHICNAALHIVTSRNGHKTSSGELNFVFLQDDIIEKYMQLYLDILTPMLQYVLELIFRTELKLYEINKESQLYLKIHNYLKKYIDKHSIKKNNRVSN